MRSILLAAATLAVVTFSAPAQDKQPESPIQLKLIAKTATYKFDGGGKTPAEYKAYLEDVAKKLGAGAKVEPPKALAVDLVLELRNTSKEEQTIHVGGDVNVYTFGLGGGAGVVTMPNPVRFTTELRLPKAVTLAPGKSHEIPVKQLSDGLRGAARLIFWTGPGEYKLAATYQLATNDGKKAAELTSAPVTITVTE
jgi:hypothetical protein